MHGPGVIYRGVPRTCGVTGLPSTVSDAILYWVTSRPHTGLPTPSKLPHPPLPSYRLKSLWGATRAGPFSNLGLPAHGGIRSGRWGGGFRSEFVRPERHWTRTCPQHALRKIAVTLNNRMAVLCKLSRMPCEHILTLSSHPLVG
jgi:hypothetical protein